MTDHDDCRRRPVVFLSSDSIHSLSGVTFGHWRGAVLALAMGAYIHNLFTSCSIAILLGFPFFHFSEGFVWRVALGRPMRFEMGAKKKKTKKNEGSRGKKRNAPSSPDDHHEESTVSSATQRKPATLAGVSEDHRYEQFFYDEGTTQQLYQLVDLYERPLLLCNPSLAVMAERKSKPYLLLDRDTRFDFLSGYRPFSLMEPYFVNNFDFDAVFIDPPFANVTPEQVARCLRLMGADRVPLYVAYNSRREDALLKAMNSLDGPNLERKWSLSYREGVSLDTQDSIWLYGPKN